MDPESIGWALEVWVNEIVAFVFAPWDFFTISGQWCASESIPCEAIVAFTLETSISVHTSRVLAAVVNVG